MNQPGGGIFDRQKKQEQKSEQVMPKQDFKSPIEAAAEQVAKTRAAVQSSVSSKTISEAEESKIIEGINKATGTDQVKQDEQALDELAKITPEDLQMAEAMIFNGYAEKTLPFTNFKDHNITVCTTSPADIDIVDEMIFDLVRENEDKKENTINLSDATVKSARNLYSLSLGFKGKDGADMCNDKLCQLNIIKKAIESLSDYEAKGDIEGMKKMKDEIKKSIRKRSAVLRKLPTPIIDFISNSKYEFDKKMFDIMSMKNIVPK